MCNPHRNPPHTHTNEAKGQRTVKHEENVCFGCSQVGQPSTRVAPKPVLVGLAGPDSPRPGLARKAGSSLERPGFYKGDVRWSSMFLGTLDRAQMVSYLLPPALARNVKAKYLSGSDETAKTTPEPLCTNGFVIQRKNVQHNGKHK